jgi:GR25 family glycosyltransferase involved in LPS biosynthesis
MAFELLTENIIKICKTEDVESYLIELWKILFEQNKLKLTSSISPLLIIPSDKKEIAITFTTCKRLNLFNQTINSILNTWTDVQRIDKWYVVDDNSSEIDRTNMVSTYPFITYYMKPYNDRGHDKSMNNIRNYILTNKFKYWIHCEDDFLFFYKMPYITTGIQGLNSLTNFNVKQIMFNRNYTETIDFINIKGHIPYTDNTFALHDYTISGNNCKYWPNFSFRPSIINTDFLNDLPDFSYNNSFFEIEYAKKYTEKGYRTAFFNFMTNIHIGKLCNSNNGLNAYNLNDVPQFGGRTYNIKVINLKKRTDRLMDISEKLKSKSLSFETIEAVDGTELVLNESLYNLFEDNDFNFKRGVIGCALSHYNLWKRLVESNDKYYIVIEDDAIFCNNFKQNLALLNELVLKSDNKYNLIFLGYLKSKDNKELYKNKYDIECNNIEIQPLNESIFIGGTHCYYISRNGAAHLIDFIESYGIKHGIDYLMGKVQKILPVYETVPHLAFAEWTDTANKIIDTDIQYDYNSVTIEETIPGYVFVKGMDQIGNDIYNEKFKSSFQLLSIANTFPSCVAFNTLGFFKNNITNLTTSNYYSDKDGIYIKQDVYENIKQDVYENKKKE